MSDPDSHVDRVTITKLDNGYYVYSETVRVVEEKNKVEPKVEKKVVAEAHYCSNLRGVTKQLYWLFEEKKRLSKDQVEGVKETFVRVKENLEQKKQQEKDDA